MLRILSRVIYLDTKPISNPADDDPFYFPYSVFIVVIQTNDEENSFYTFACIDLQP